MATPHFGEYVELVGSGGTLLLGSKAIFCQDFSDLFRTGRSVGDNTRVGGVGGELERARTRGGLAVQLRGVTVDGYYDEDNVAVASGSRRSNTLTLFRKVANFFDDSCTGRTFTVRLTVGATVYEGDGQYVEDDVWRWANPTFGTTNLMIRVSDGVLTETP